MIKTPWFKNPIRYAAGITMIILPLGAYILYEKEVWKMDGNEIGDFTAGFAGALSFVWIITTILLQKTELELQRQEVANLANESKIQSIAMITASKLDLKNRLLEIFATTHKVHFQKIKEMRVNIEKYLCGDNNFGKKAKQAFHDRYLDERYYNFREIQFYDAFTDHAVDMHLSEPVLTSIGFEVAAIYHIPELEYTKSNLKKIPTVKLTIASMDEFEMDSIGKLGRKIAQLASEEPYFLEVLDILKDAHKLELLSIVNSLHSINFDNERDIVFLKLIFIVLASGINDGSVSEKMYTKGQKVVNRRLENQIEAARRLNSSSR